MAQSGQGLAEQLGPAYAAARDRGLSLFGPSTRGDVLPREVNESIQTLEPRSINLPPHRVPGDFTFFKPSRPTDQTLHRNPGLLKCSHEVPPYQSG
jgi:hypothetical protein